MRSQEIKPNFRHPYLQKDAFAPYVDPEVKTDFDKLYPEQKLISEYVKVTEIAEAKHESKSAKQARQKKEQELRRQQEAFKLQFSYLLNLLRRWGIANNASNAVNGIE